LFGVFFSYGAYGHGTKKNLGKTTVSCCHHAAAAIKFAVAEMREDDDGFGCEAYRPSTDSTPLGSSDSFLPLCQRVAPRCRCRHSHRRRLPCLSIFSLPLVAISFPLPVFPFLANLHL